MPLDANPLDIPTLPPIVAGPVLRRLEDDAGFRLSESLKADTLRAVGEA